MNTSLFRSRHLPIAAAIVAACALLSAAWDAPFGRVAGADRTFLLATGWVSLGLLLVVMAYVLRKYAHRGRYSPEFARKVNFAALERADNGIQRLRQRINTGALGTRKMIEAEAAVILKEAGVQRVNRALVEPGPPGGAPWTVRLVPTEPMGRVARWMHVHAFYGTAFGALLWMHSGSLPQSTFGLCLAGLGYLVFTTGILGIFLWAKGPSWLTARERDLSIEEASALSAGLGRKREEALESFEGDLARELTALSRGSLPGATKLRGRLQELTRLAPEREADIQDAAALMAQERAVATELRALQRVRASFMAWKLVHIPAALLLTGLVVVHVVSIWRY